MNLYTRKGRLLGDQHSIPLSDLARFQFVIRAESKKEALAAVRRITTDGDRARQPDNCDVLDGTAGNVIHYPDLD